MPFELFNAPNTFMHLMNKVFWPFIKKFVVVNFNDILLWRSSCEKHLQHLQRIFEVLGEQKLFVNLKKCSFFTIMVISLRYVVTGQWAEVNQSKIDAIVNWLFLKTIHDERSFYELAFFYYWFNINFSIIAAPLTKCMKTYNFIWNDIMEQSFKELKRQLT